MIIDFVMYLNYIMRNKKSIRNDWFLYTENMQIDGTTDSGNQ